MARRTVPLDPSIGERIQARRQLRRWSIRFAASRAGVAHTTWSRVEKGEMRTDRYMIAEFAAALECSVTDLTGQPYIPADRALETAHACVPPLRQAVLEVAPDEPPARPLLPLAELTARMDLLDARRTESDYAAVGQVLPDLLLDLHAAGSGPDGRSALVMLVDATHTAMGMLGGLGYLGDSALAAERCRQTAEQLGDPVPLAVADWSRASAAAGLGAYRRSYTLASRAADELGRHLAEDGALAMLGMLHLSSAQAMLRAKPDDAFAHLAEAAELAARTGETREWWMFFGPANVGVWRMGALVDAGEAGRAIDAASTVNPTELPSAERRAMSYLEMARALTDFGGVRDQEAERALLTAERLAPQRVRSYTAARATARFLLDRARRRSALFGLCERMGIG